MSRILFHACCGPCASAVIDGINENHQIEPAFYFFNPYIQPFLEHEKRKASFEFLMQALGTEYLIEDTYDMDTLTAYQASNDPRCLHCYQRRLEAVALKAAALNYNGFSTTLLISPYQNHQMLREVGEQVALKTGVAFYYTDYRPFFKQYRINAERYGLYRQKYCGCIYSEYDRYSSEKLQKGKIRDVEKSYGVKL